MSIRIYIDQKNLVFHEDKVKFCIGNGRYILKQWILGFKLQKVTYFRLFKRYLNLRIQGCWIRSLKAKVMEVLKAMCSVGKIKWLNLYTHTHTLTSCSI